MSVKLHSTPERIGHTKRTKSSRELIQLWESGKVDDGVRSQAIPNSTIDDAREVQSDLSHEEPTTPLLDAKEFEQPTVYTPVILDSIHLVDNSNLADNSDINHFTSETLQLECEPVVVSSSTSVIEQYPVKNSQLPLDGNALPSPDLSNTAIETPWSVPVNQPKVEEIYDLRMQQKQKAIRRLEALGYDPYTGIYVAHRKYLMQEKTKVITRLETLGYDPYKGVYAAHRPVLMAIKSKVIDKLEQMGFDPFKGLYMAHRGFLMQEKQKVIDKLTALGFNLTGERQ